MTQPGNMTRSFLIKLALYLDSNMIAPFGKIEAVCELDFTPSIISCVFDATNEVLYLKKKLYQNKQNDTQQIHTKH